MVVGEIMTAEPIFATTEMSVEEVIEVLYENDIRHLPIVDEDGDLVGIISDRDLRSFALPALSEFDNREAINDALASSITTIMTGDVISVDVETDVSEVIDLMIQTRAGAVPVVDQDTQELVGIVSYIDVLKALRDAL